MSSFPPGDVIGGDQGTEAVMGCFPQYATWAQREQGWKIIEGILPNHLSELVEKIATPGMRGPVIIVTLKSDPEGPKRNREVLKDFCAQIREAKLRYKFEDQTFDVWVAPTKPYEIRQRDAEATLKADAIRVVFGEPRASEIEFEIGKGRAFLGQELLTQRKYFGGPVEYIFPTLQRLLPELTPEMLEEAEAKVKESRLAGNRLR